MIVKQVPPDQFFDLLPWILEGEESGFRWPWKEESWRDLNWEHHHLYLLSLDTQPIGFCLFQSLPGDDSCHLLKIFVIPAEQGKGKGKYLLKASLNYEDKKGKTSCFLEVESVNRPAIALYESLNFQKMREISGFYSDGTDAAGYLKTWSA